VGGGGTYLRSAPFAARARKMRWLTIDSSADLQSPEQKSATATDPSDTRAHWQVSRSRRSPTTGYSAGEFLEVLVPRRFIREFFRPINGRHRFCRQDWPL